MFVHYVNWLGGIKIIGDIMPKIMIEMEMPKSCAECKFCLFQFDLNMYCSALRECFHGTDNSIRMKECPLQEVKE